jgi:D-alanyl-lipoteichoic acid acyltransferase DltB (MBOAT superfamily)
MLFNSIDFAIFLSIIFILYWFVTNKNLRLQNLLIVISSYIFYGWWDWRFLSLILFSTIIDYFIGIKLSKQEYQTKRKILLWTSIFVNLGFLGFFKYYNFFLDNFITAFSFFGTEINANSLNIILPVGIRHFQKALKPLYLQGFYCIFIVTKTPKMTYNVKKRGFQK